MSRGCRLDTLLLKLSLLLFFFLFFIFSYFLSSPTAGLFNTQKAGQDFAVPQLRIPLVMLIDYLGHRLVSMSLLPINEKTLLYGSSDAGKTVNASPIIKQTVADAADLLKLKLHKVGKSPEHLVAVQLPCDIEVHRGLDGRFYCIDFARLFPPEPPSGQQKTSPPPTGPNQFSSLTHTFPYLQVSSGPRIS